MDPPKDLFVDDKWDKFIDLSLRRTVYGTLAGALVAAMIFRGPCTRGAAIAYGAGFGGGSAWQVCSKDFEGFLPSRTTSSSSTSGNGGGAGAGSAEPKTA